MAQRKHRLEITINFDENSDAKDALEEVMRKVMEDYIQGFDRNETSNYVFTIKENKIA